MADAAPPAQQEVIQLGEGWISVREPGQAPFYVHQPSNTTQWEEPALSASPDPVKALAAALIAKYSLTDNRTATAAAGRLAAWRHPGVAAGVAAARSRRNSSSVAAPAGDSRERGGGQHQRAFARAIAPGAERARGALGAAGRG